MPTIFSKCSECNYIDLFPIEHNLNKYYKLDVDKMEILKKYGLPTEIAIKIVKYTYTYHNCDYCNYSILCDTHKNRALVYGGGLIKCDQCCWDEIT